MRATPELIKKERKVLAANIRRLCKERRVSLRRFSIDAPINESYLHEILAARANITVGILARIASYFNVSVDLLFTDPASPESQTQGGECPMPKDENPNIQVELTDASEFHCFRLTLNPQSAPGQKIEIMLHARSLVDLIHKCNLALCDFQAQTTDFLLKRLGAR